MNLDRPYQWDDWTTIEVVGHGFGRGGGLYRVRDAGTEEILYVGESSRISGRMSDLRNCLKEVIPYADPHTAAPALWAYIMETGHRLEVSLARFDEQTSVRKSFEAVEISLLRDQAGQSPMFSFGRMMPGWTKSSPNNSRLKNAGKLYKGSRAPDIVPPRSLPPIVAEAGTVTSEDWCGLMWTGWTPNLPTSTPTGLYRIRHAGMETLQYIGIGLIRNRLSAHLKKGCDSAHPQFEYFKAELEFSWSEHNDLHATQLAELENDLIASHVLTTGAAPPAQFKG